MVGSNIGSRLGVDKKDSSAKVRDGSAYRVL